MNYPDHIQNLVNVIFDISACYEEKMILLTTIDPLIQQEYNAGRTAFKPAHLFTADDFEF